MVTPRYVIERILVGSELEIEDYIRVEDINVKDKIVTLQPLLTEKYTVTLAEFERDYCIV